MMEADEVGKMNKPKRRKVETVTANPDLNGDGTQQTDGSMEGSRTGSEKPAKSFAITVQVPKWLCYSGVVISVLVALTAVLVSLVTPERPDLSEWMAEVQDRVGKDGVALFTAYDLNRDGYLSVLEFEPLIPHLENLTSVVSVMPKDEFFHYTPKDGEEVFIIDADFEPLQLETMTKEGILTMDFGASNPLYGLKSWQTPHMPNAVFGAMEFSIFLPKDTENVALGKPYHILPQKPTGGLFDAPSHLSSARFYPPAPKEQDSVLYRLLGMMHSRPFVEMRFPPRGTVACVRAYNSKYLHIVFRMHAEYQLNEPPTNPFWFTPAQFAGDLVISRDGSHIAYFHMEVPNTRRLNVDMEWLSGGSSENDQGMEVDIGYMPKMEWTITGASHLPAEGQSASENKNPEEQDLQEKAPEDLKKPDEFLWDSLIDQESALRLIETEFYPFKVVTYHNLTKAHQLSREQNKPIHAQRFVSTWALVVDLQALEKDENDPVMSEFAKTLLSEYEFPVMMMVIAPNGTIVHKVNANEFLDMESSVFETGLQNPSSFQYEQFLKEGLRKLEGESLPAA
ncbi:hypothetical protein BaRGS_00027589 [Batillaria attramentaria]|uniref:EF-hand domain-containing protein n=1 Tax=Batillaria attramentaria TaxID=370345 RepID=A0ABD0K2P5_9CAEN